MQGGIRALCWFYRESEVRVHGCKEGLVAPQYKDCQPGASWSLHPLAFLSWPSTLEAGGHSVRMARGKGRHAAHHTGADEVPLYFWPHFHSLQKFANILLSLFVWRQLFTSWAARSKRSRDTTHIQVTGIIVYVHVLKSSWYCFGSSFSCEAVQFSRSVKRSY